MKVGTRTAIASLLSICVAAIAGTDDLELARFTLDSGGVMRSTGGTFELSATIGQPDAGVMSGGNIELTSGFWFGLAPTDCNDDGAVNLLDYNALAECLTGPGVQVPSECACFDIDMNGTTDLRDFAVAQSAFVTQ